jgi:Uma2 family endonuclease
MSTVPRPGRPAAVPPLRDGDRLSREEFERRYDAMPDLKKAELIEGVVHMPSPARHNRHSRPHAQVVGWLIQYESATPGVQTGAECSTRLALASMPQPDALLLIDPERGGRARISDDDYVEGGPELVAEVAASSDSLDATVKRRLYLRNGVCEYVLWRVADGELDWFVRRGNRFVRLRPGRDGVLRSQVFPGLWLDRAALLRGDLAAVLGVLQQGLASPEHAAFVARLRQPGPPAP